jgi:autoinducer 2 (AI-2) kinase
VVEGALGAPPIPPDITLKMKADIFDGMMTGRVNGTQAAMTGKLTFTGDTSKAMAMTKIARDMGRLYESACEQVGDPGDLTALGAPTAVPPAPPAAGTPGTPTGVPRPTRGSGTGDERDEIVAVVEELYAKNLITATGGNVSVRVSGRPDTCWITPSQMFKGSLHAGMMVRIDLDGHSLDEDALAPSSEKLVHTAIYRSRPEIQAIVHSHAPWSTLLALTETPLLPVSTEAAFLGEVPLVPFIMPGTADLAQAVSTAMGRHGSVVLMQNHGPVVAAANLRRAANLSEVVERTAEMILRCKALGREPAMLPAEAVQTLREVGQMMG